MSLCSKFHSYKGDLNAIQQYRFEESFIQLLYGIGFQIYIFFFILPREEFLSKKIIKGRITNCGFKMPLRRTGSGPIFFVSFHFLPLFQIKSLRCRYL